MKQHPSISLILGEKLDMGNFCILLGCEINHFKFLFQIVFIFKLMLNSKMNFFF